MPRTDQLGAIRLAGCISSREGMQTHRRLSGAGATAASVKKLRVTGVVSALSLPAIIVDNSFSVVLSTTADTTFSEVLPLIVAQIAAGQTVQAHVTKSATGTLTADFVNVSPASPA